MKRRLLTLLFILFAGIASAQYSPTYGTYVRTLSWSGETWYMMQWGDATGIPTFGYQTYSQCLGKRVQYVGQYTETTGTITTTYAILSVIGTAYQFYWPRYRWNGIGYTNYLEPAP